ncbi:MAG: nucleoside-diphosphate sugar epimerase [Rhizobiales bacterium NRL2]|jgi:nucleoside-diphosphate-sugar epimerase|nr:MAG: nucleoside-diphosphate sugar epimerase [Rhizobiales bacterium NRL2]
MSATDHPLKGRKVVIIGGAGFIGHNMALTMKQAGVDVAVVDSLGVNNYYAIERERYTNPNGEIYLNFIKQRMNLLHEARVPFVEMDARDYHGLSETMEDLNPDAIVHLAAVAHANRSNKDPYSTFDHSLRTLENALDVARSSRLNVDRFVYFSSSMVYGTFADGVVDEETSCNPLGIYGALKFAGEKMVIAYNQVFGLPFTIIRPSALYGERCVSRRVGQALIENALRGNTLTINGDGSDCLDFTYVQDLIGGVMGALTSKDAANEIFNLTYGDARSLNQMVDIIRQHFPGIDVKHNPRDSLMPERGTLNVDKARSLIGYDPQYPLERGFVDYIDWYKANWDQLNQGGVDAGQVVYLTRRAWA